MSPEARTTDVPVVEDGRRRRGARTREAILERAMAIASETGLEALSIGGLADALGMSKSGLFAHFGSKEELQLATVDAARQVFVDVVVRPTRGLRGVARLHAFAESFVEYLRRQVFPGGCFFAAAATEFDSRPGPVRDAIVRNMQSWRGLVHDTVVEAIELGELRADADTKLTAFQINAVLTGANADYQLEHDPAVLDYAVRSVDAILATQRA